jgi:hypothetical protein
MEFASALSAVGPTSPAYAQQHSHYWAKAEYRRRHGRRHWLVQYRRTLLSGFSTGVKQGEAARAAGQQ